MKLSSIVLGAVLAVAVIAVLLLVTGVSFHRPLTAQGAALYDSKAEVTVKGTVERVEDFACPVSEGEMGSHLILKTDQGPLQIHLVAARIMRSHKLSFAPGDQLEVFGSRLAYRGGNDIIAREITRGNVTMVFRDEQGRSMLLQ